MEAIINLMLDFAREHLFTHVLLILLTTIVLIVSMGIDLIAGVRKAKQSGIARTSTGYKKTCDKARKYCITDSLVIFDMDEITSNEFRYAIQ